MIYISIGSNLGNRLAYLQQAVDLLKQRYLRNMRCSIVLETECILPDDAPDDWNRPYLNMIAIGESDLSPEQLLQGLKKMEQELGRPEFTEKWSPRVVDLDILLWDDCVIDTVQLKIPHQQLQNRPFLIHLLAIMGFTCEIKQSLKNSFLESFVVSPRFVGIVNITPDSFSDGGCHNAVDKALEQIVRLSEEGASIVEIGAQSTRPGATLQSSEEEFLKLKPVLDALKSLMEAKKIEISVDTFSPKVIQKVLKSYPVSWINDVTGDLDEETLNLILEHNCNLFIMHSLGIPSRVDTILPSLENPINYILDWAKEKTDNLWKAGFKKKSVGVDPGIGFGKNAYQNMEILRHAEELKLLGISVLMGHSRKSFMESFSIEKAKDRDIETIAISALLARKVDYLRVHNIADHMRFFVAQQAIKGVCHVFS